MSGIMKMVRLPIASDLATPSLEEAVLIIKKNSDIPVTLLCSRTDYFVAQRIFKECGVKNYSYIPYQISNDADAWMVIGEKTVVYSEGG